MPKAPASPCRSPTSQPPSPYEPAAVPLRVADDGAAADADGHALAATGGGYGLSGIKERAELWGGTLCAGPNRAGWVVDLRVPP